MLDRNPLNNFSAQYEEERTQDRALWYTMPKWNEFRNYILEGYSLGPVSEERSKPFQHWSTNSKKHFKTLQKDVMIHSIECSTQV